MTHSIYAGSFASLETRLIETIADLQRYDPLFEINVLSGSNLLALYLKRRLAENRRTAGNIRFHTFPDLLSRLNASDPPSEKPHLPRLGPSILLEDMLAEHSPPIYAPLSGYRGFRDALLDTFRDLRDAGFGTAELESAIQACKGIADRRQHLTGFADLYRRFRERASNFHDVDDDFRSAIRNASDSRVSLGIAHLLVYGIYDATGQQSRLLAALKNSMTMIYFIPFADEAASNFAMPFFEARAEELKVKPVQLRSTAPSNSLEHLAARGFGFSPESVRGRAGRSSGSRTLAADGSFALVSAPGESRAAIEIIREIFRAAHDGTISGFYEAAVILRQPETDTPILTEMFRLHRVPYFIQGGGRLAERPLSKAVVALSNLESDQFSRESVLNVMELVAASLPEKMQHAWDVQSWRSLTNDPGFLSGAHSWDEGTDAAIERARRKLEHSGSESADVSADVSGARSIDAIKKHLAGALLLRDAWHLIKYAAADWPARMSWQEWAHFLEHRLEQFLGASDDWPVFSAVFDEIANLHVLDRCSKGGGVALDRLKSALVESVESLSCPAGRFQRSGVSILSTSAARGLRFPLVIIPSLDEGRFPAKLRQDPLLLDSERLQMRDLPVKSRRIDEEKLLFDMAARSAEKRLVLMTSRLDENSDRERLPSQFLLRVAAEVHGGTVTMRDLAQGTVAGYRSVSLDNPAPKKEEIPVDEGEIRLRQITARRETARGVLADLADMEPIRLKRPLAYDRARWVNRLTEFDGFISDPVLVQRTAEKIGASAGQVSASRIEEYTKCPYYFFLKRVMNLESWEEPGKAEGMDPLERGLAIHSILESFLKSSGDAIYQATSTEEFQGLLEKKAHADLDRARPAGLPDLLWEVERDALIDMLKNWLAFEAERAGDDMRIIRLEQPFGKFASEEELPPLRVNAGRQTFDFRGRIDRIDISSDRKRARVIDYKTGALPESMANTKTRTPLMSGERIQIAIYRGALSVLNDFENLESIEGEYLHLQPKDGRIVACFFTNEELQKASQLLPDVLEMVGDGLEHGVFFARTRGVIRPNGHCDFCDYLPVCGKDRVRREERKAGDPAVRKFFQIMEQAQ